MKKIIVFGANGGTGSNFIRYFLEHNRDYKIIAVGTKERFVNETPNVDYFKVDITKKDSFNNLPKTDVFAVVHLAGAMPARMEGYDPYKYIDVNIIGTLNILEYCRLAKVDRILYAQSFGDIKDHAESNPLLTVNLPRKFSFTTDHTVYVLTKNFAVDLIENYHQMYGLKRFIFRLPTIYLYSKKDFYFVDGVKRKLGYRALIDKAIAGEDIEIWGDPTRKKDMVYVDDFCQMMFKSLFVDLDSGFYNVGTGVGTSLLEQINGIIEVFCKKGKESKIIFAPEKPNAPQYVMDISNAIKELDYHPQYDYISMLKEIKRKMDEEVN